MEIKTIFSAESVNNQEDNLWQVRELLKECKSCKRKRIRMNGTSCQGWIKNQQLVLMLKLQKT